MAEAPRASPHYVSACVRVGDFEVTYLAAGGPPEVPARETVLLLHGFGAWSEVVWSRTIPALAERYRVIAPDLIGFGLSSKPRAGFFLDDPLEAEAKFLVEFLDAVGVDKVIVVGSSFGGALALHMASTMPERVSRVVLVGSMGLGRSIHYAYKALAAPFLGARLVRPDRERIRRMWRWTVHDPRLVTDEIVDRNFELLSEPGAAEVLTAARVGVNLVGQKIHFRGLLRNIRQPTLLVWGREDAVFPVRHARRAARRLPDADLVVLDECGHLPPFEAPHLFNEVLLQFLARAPKVRRHPFFRLRASPKGESMPGRGRFLPYTTPLRETE